MTIDLKIHKDKKEESKPEVDKIEFSLKLEKTPIGNVVLMAIDKHGEQINQGNILMITTSGTIRLCENINPALGFQLDEKNRVEIKKEDEIDDEDESIKRLIHFLNLTFKEI